MPNDAGVETRNVAGAITSMGIGEMISKLAIGIAEGQLELDTVCMQIAQFMGNAEVAFGKRAGTDEPDLISLIELGFTPNFYQFVDTILEVRVAVSSQFEEQREYDTSDAQLHQDEVEQQSQYEAKRSGSSYGYGQVNFGWWGGSQRVGYGSSAASSSSQTGSSSYKSKNLQLTTVDAKYASKYNYAVEASSLVKTKIVPVPPPDVFEEIVRSKVQERREEEARRRLSDQVLAILPGLVSSTQAILADEDRLPESDIAASTYKREKAVELQDAVAKLQEDYRGLTTEHWAVIKSVQDREVADKAIAAAIDRTRQISGNYEEELPGALPADTSLMFGLLTTLRNDLGKFKAKAEEIRGRLAPPDEEQPTTEEGAL